MNSNITINLYVRSGAPYLASAGSASSYLSYMGDSPYNASYFLAIALYRVEQLLNTYSSVTANIYLGKGDHYFFFCDPDVLST
jgi:hypothetical protein